MADEMRKVYLETMTELMGKDDRIVILDSDLAKANGTYPLHQKFPDRSYNVGVAEANMAGVAAGMASYGLLPFIHTFTPFATRRIFDQVYISIAYAGMNVKIVGTDPGIAAELNGGTHTGIDDMGMMRAVPGMVVYEPVDNTQLRQALPQIVKHEGPMFIRMARKGVPEVFDAGYKFDLFKADVLRQGTDITLFSSGIEVKQSLEAADALAQDGVKAEVINIHTLKPLDKDTVIASLKKTGVAVTCENHTIYNGLGSAVMEVASEHCPTPILRVGMQDRFGEVGKVDYLIKAFNLTAADIVAKAKEALALKKK